MHPDLWLAIKVSNSSLSVSLGPEHSNVLHCSGQLSEKYGLVGDAGRDLSRLPWTISIFRGTATAAGGASVGVAYPVVDPDRPGENDFLAAEATVTDTQFDRLLQLLSVAVSAPEIHLAISGLTYGSGLENATRVWTLPDTLPISTARMTADVSGRPYLANVPA